MNEAEILELTALARTNLFSAIQWWASVTFGLIALTHFGRKTLNLPIVTIVACIYVSFSCWLAIIAITQIQELVSLGDDLRSLVSDSYQLSQTGLGVVDAPPALTFALRALAAVAIFGAFFSSIGYLIWTYRRGAQP